MTDTLQASIRAKREARGVARTRRDSGPVCRLIRAAFAASREGRVFARRAAPALHRWRTVLRALLAGTAYAAELRDGEPAGSR